MWASRTSLLLYVRRPSTEMWKSIPLLESYTFSLTNTTVITCAAKPEILPYVHGCKHSTTCVEEIDTSMLRLRSSPTVSNIILAMDRVIIRSLLSCRSLTSELRKRSFPTSLRVSNASQITKTLSTVDSSLCSEESCI